MARMEITFDGFNDLLKDIYNAGNSIKKAADEALEETQRMIQSELRNASSRYSAKGGGKGYATGRMYKQLIKDEKPKWDGTVATIHVGFSFKKPAALHSIFLMYGTPRHAVKNQYGTPKRGKTEANGITQDKDLFDAIFGDKVKSKVQKKQEEVLRKYLKIGG